MFWPFVDPRSASQMCAENCWPQKVLMESDSPRKLRASFADTQSVCCFSETVGMTWNLLKLLASHAAVSTHGRPAASSASEGASHVLVNIVVVRGNALWFHRGSWVLRGKMENSVLFLKKKKQQTAKFNNLHGSLWNSCNCLSRKDLKQFQHLELTSVFTAEICVSVNIQIPPNFLCSWSSLQQRTKPTQCAQHISITILNSEWSAENFSQLYIQNTE